MPVTAARGAAARTKSFQAIPVERARPPEGGNGRFANSGGKSCGFSGTSRSCSGEETLICGAPQAEQNGVRSSMSLPQRWQIFCIHFQVTRSHSSFANKSKPGPEIDIDFRHEMSKALTPE
jgi:hypothetical protein